MNKIKHKTPEAKALATQEIQKRYKEKRSTLACYLEEKQKVIAYAEIHDITLMEALKQLLKDVK